MITPITYNYINQSKYFRDNCKNQSAVSFTGVDFRKLNPIYNFSMRYFGNTVKASSKRYSPISNSLIGKVNEVLIKTGDKKTLYGWDIKSGNSKRYVIFFHGASINISNCQNIYKTIIDSNINVLAPEYRGFEKNKPCKFNLKRFKKDMNDIYNYLTSKGVKPSDIGIIGHSMGGYLATVTANKYPESAFLMLINPIYAINYKFSNPFNNKNLSRQMPVILRKFLKRFPKSLNVLSRALNLEKIIPQIKTPTYVIHSRNDNVIKLESSQELVKKLKNMREFIIIDGNKHILEDTKLDAVNKILAKI